MISSSKNFSYIFDSICGGDADTKKIGSVGSLKLIFLKRPRLRIRLCVPGTFFLVKAFSKIVLKSPPNESIDESK